MQSYHWALKVNIVCMHKMVVVLGSADCVKVEQTAVWPVERSVWANVQRAYRNTGTTAGRFRCK